MLNNCRFFLNPGERDLLRDSRRAFWEKQELLMRVEAGRIMARGSFHTHKVGCRRKDRKDNDCRYMFMRCPSEGNKLYHVLDTGEATEIIPPPPSHIDSNIPIPPLDYRAICLLVERVSPYSRSTLDSLSYNVRKECRDVSLRSLYTEEGCLWLTNCVRCNTSVKLMSSQGVARRRMWYCVKYMCKGPVDTKEFSNICQISCNKTTVHPSLKEAQTVSERSQNDNVLALQRILMKTCAFSEYGANQMMSCVLGYPAQYQTHSTTLIFIKQALCFQEILYANSCGPSPSDKNYEWQSDSSSDKDLTDFIVSDNVVEYQDSEEDTDHLSSPSSMFKCSRASSKLCREVCTSKGDPCENETMFSQAPLFPWALANENGSSADDEIPDDLATPIPRLLCEGVPTVSPYSSDTESHNASFSPNLTAKYMVPDSLRRLLVSSKMKLNDVLFQGSLFKVVHESKTTHTTIPPYFLYANRGVYLDPLSFLEWGCSIEVVYWDDTASVQYQNFQSKIVGKRWCYPFKEDFVLYDTYLQRYRSTYRVPQLAGMRPPRFPGPRPASVKKLARWKKKADKFATFIGTLLIPWDLERPNQIRTLYDLQYCYKFNNGVLAVNEETPHDRNYINSLKQKYIHRLSTNLCDGEEVAKHVRSFEKQFADTLDHIQLPRTRGRFKPEAVENILTAKDETQFLQQLNQYKTVGRSCLCKNTSECLDTIDLQLKRRYRQGGEVGHYISSCHQETSQFLVNILQI